MEPGTDSPLRRVIDLTGIPGALDRIDAGETLHLEATESGYAEVKGPPECEHDTPATGT